MTAPAVPLIDLRGLDANPDVLVGVLPGRVAEGDHPLYTPVTVSDHLWARLDATDPS